MLLTVLLLPDLPTMLTGRLYCYLLVVRLVRCLSRCLWPRCVEPNQLCRRSDVSAGCRVGAVQYTELAQWFAHDSHDEANLLGSLDTDGAHYILYYYVYYARIAGH